MQLNQATYGLQTLNWGKLGREDVRGNCPRGNVLGGSFQEINVLGNVKQGMFGEMCAASCRISSLYVQHTETDR